VLRVRTELNGELRFERALQRYKFEDMKLSGELTGDPLQGKTMTFSAQGQICWTRQPTSPNGPASRSRPTSCAPWVS
jgi:hypothetical protein